MKIVGTEESLRLTKEASIDFNPVWSPDGRYIAFCRILKGETGIYIIPASSGTERRVRETLWQDQDPYQARFSAGGLSWSPDGKLLAFSDRASRNENASSIFLLSLDSSEIRRLTSSPSRWDFKSGIFPRWSNRGLRQWQASGFCGFYLHSTSFGRTGTTPYFGSFNGGVLPGPLTVATSFCQFRLDLQRGLAAENLPFAGVNQNDCSSVK